VALILFTGAAVSGIRVHRALANRSHLQVNTFMWPLPTAARLPTGCPEIARTLTQDVEVIVD
jgi:hypothetical protein